MLPLTRRLLTGHPPALPAPLDRCAEAWWRANPRTRWLTGLTLVSLLLSAGVGHVASSPYGPPVAIWVAAHDVPVGARLTPQDLERTSWPADLVPPAAAEDPRDAVVRAPLPGGAAVTTLHLGEEGIGGQLSPDELAVAVPRDTLPGLPPGSLLDLVGAHLDGTATSLSVGVRVLHDDGDDVWLAVPAGDAVEVSAAAAGGSLVAVVRPA